MLHHFLQREPLSLKFNEEDNLVHLGHPLARYWQTAVWEKVFDHLLNSDAPTALAAARKELQVYLGQNPMRARLLRLALGRLENSMDME